MINFSFARESDHSFTIRVRTPLTQVGTLHRLISAIYVLGLDVISGHVETLQKDGVEFTEDSFLLQLNDTDRNDDVNMMSARLGMLMETVMQENSNPVDLLKQHNMRPPEVTHFFDTLPVIVFQDHPEDATTQFHIEAANRRGLLFHLTRVLTEKGVNIRRGIISENNGYATDTFYLQYKEGALGEEMSTKIEAEILGKPKQSPVSPV